MSVWLQLNCNTRKSLLLQTGRGPVVCNETVLYCNFIALVGLLKYLKWNKTMLATEPNCAELLNIAWLKIKGKKNKIYICGNLNCLLMNLTFDDSSAGWLWLSIKCLSSLFIIYFKLLHRQSFIVNRIMLCTVPFMLAVFSRQCTSCFYYELYFPFLPEPVLLMLIAAELYQVIVWNTVWH